MSNLQFNRDAVKRWRRAVWRELHRLDFHSGPDADVGLVIIAVSGFGTGLDVLVEVTGKGRAFVRDVLKRMRQAKVLRGQSLSIRWHDKGFAGQVALGLDIMATVGQIQRVGNPKRTARRKKTRRAGSEIQRRKPIAVAPSAIFTPKVKQGDAWYQSTKGAS